MQEEKISQEDSPSSSSIQALLRLHRLHKSLNLSKTACEAVENLIVPKEPPVQTILSTPAQALWQDALQAGDIDLAWRILCVLRHKGSLPVYAERLWTLLGEGGALPRVWSPLGEKSIEMILHATPTVMQSYLRGYLQLRPRLSELFPSTATRLAKKQPQIMASALLETKSQEWKKNTAWLFPRPSFATWIQRVVKRKRMSLPLPTWMPSAVVPEELTYVLALLSEAFGYSCWNWDITHLQRGVQLTSAAQSPVWRTFTASQRGACLQWGKMQDPPIDLETLQRGMDIFLVQCALLVLQDHTLWMQSLANGGAPAWLQEALQDWILSPIYSQIRIGSPHRFVLAVPPMMQHRFT